MTWWLLNQISCQQNYKGEQPCSTLVSTIADKTTVVLKFTTIPQITCSCVVSGQCYCHKCIQHENVWERTLLDTQLRMTLRYGIIKHCCIHHLTWQISLCSATSTMSVRGFLRWTLLPCLRTQWPKFMFSFSQTWCVHWSFCSCWTLGMSVWVNVVLYPRLVEFCMPTSCTRVKCKLGIYLHSIPCKSSVVDKLWSNN